MNLAVFGGSFDPVHLGHVAMVDHLLEHELAAEVILVPAALSPFKSGHSASGDRRLAMLKLVFGSRPQVVVDDRELRRAGPSYTIDTLESLAAERPQDRLWLVVGQDILPQLPRWRAVDRALALAGLIVFPRGEPDRQQSDGSDPAAVLRKAGLVPLAIRVASGFHEPVSSRAVRATLRVGGEVGRLVPAEVAAYIRKHGLYNAGS